jgi:pyruvate kinase
MKNDFAFIAASFIRKADNVAEIKNLLESKNNKTIKIISKIENKQ